MGRLEIGFFYGLVGQHKYPHMNRTEFSIGLEFLCNDKRWRCTDIGTRVVTAICLEPREMVRSEAPEAAERDFETAFVAFLHHRGH